MLNVEIFIFVVFVSFNPNGIDSQNTIEDDVCDVWLLKQEIDALRMSQAQMERQLKTCSQRSVDIHLVKRLNQSTPVECDVNGFTKRRGRIYVLCRSSKSIRALDDREWFDIPNEVSLTKIGSPHDIVYNDRSKCFYVTSYNDEYIWQVTMTDDNQTQGTKWRKGTTHPYKISLSSDGHLLALRKYTTRSGLSDNDEESTIFEIENYNASNAQLIRRLKLHSDIRQPLHVIQASTGGEFLISHHWLKDDGPWVVSRVSSDGQRIIAQSTPRNDAEILKGPWYLSLDSDNDRLFVADHQNDRVILFDSESLDFREVLLSKERNGIQGPKRMYYDKEEKHLIVGHSINAIDVYKIY